MQIETLKELKNGYLVNGSIFVPSDPKNSDFQKIQKWIDENGAVDTFDFFEDAKAEKIAQIKSKSGALILATYPTYKQLNILMSHDQNLIVEMNSFILEIREKSNELEAALSALSDLEDIKKFPIQF